MSASTTNPATPTTVPPAPRRGLRGAFGIIGPGLVLAAAGVGAGDMISSLNAGASYGLTLVWAVVIGVLVKYIVTDNIGRWSLVTGTSPIRGFHRLSKAFTGYFGIYSLIIGFFYGAAIASALGLSVNAMFPEIDTKVGAIVAVLVGLVVLWIGRYAAFERIMSVFVAVMFVSIVGAAVLAQPDPAVLLSGFTPQVPEGGTFYVLGIMGGVGMSIGLLSYGDWLRERGWTGPAWVRAMRIDLIVGYGMTFVFMVAMMVVGAAFLQGSGGEVSGLKDLHGLANSFGDRYGAVAKWLLLIGVFSAVYSSLLGGYNALAHVFSDLFGVWRGRALHSERGPDAGTPVSATLPYRAYLVWMGVVPLSMLFFDRPVLLVLVYAALGALFMPALIAALLWLMNSKLLERRHRNGIAMNVALVLGLLLFVALGVNELLTL